MAPTLAGSATSTGAAAATLSCTGSGVLADAVCSGGVHLTRVGQSGADARWLGDFDGRCRRDIVLHRIRRARRRGLLGRRGGPSDQGRAKRRRRSLARRLRRALPPRHRPAPDQACSPMRSARAAWRAAASEQDRARRRRHSPARRLRRALPPQHHTGTGSGVLADEVGTGGVAGGSIGSGKTAAMRAVQATSKCGAAAATSSSIEAGVLADAVPLAIVAGGVAASIGVLSFPMPEPRLASPATQPMRTSVPHNTFSTACRCWLITLPPCCLVQAPREPSWTGHQTKLIFGSKCGHGLEENCKIFIFFQMCCRNTTLTWIMVNFWILGKLYGFLASERGRRQRDGRFCDFGLASRFAMASARSSASASDETCLAWSLRRRAPQCRTAFPRPAFNRARNFLHTVAEIEMHR